MLSYLLEIDWNALLFGEEELSFLPETAIRSFVMFSVILFGLRLLGKRGVTQLSVFELGLIIGLGSAAGDPMFYKDVGILVSITVLSVVLGLYWLVTMLINKSDRIEELLEGKATTILVQGILLYKDFEKEPIARDELFSQLRMKGISQLGQVEQAIIETDGEVSVFFSPDNEVRYGLPILPQYHQQKVTQIKDENVYACTICGTTEKLEPAAQHTCKECKNKEWIVAVNSKRIT